MASLAQAGQIDEARAALAQLQKLQASAALRLVLKCLLMTQSGHLARAGITRIPRD